MDYKARQVSYDVYIRFFNERVKNYIPPLEEWTPVDHALFAPPDLYRVPLDEAEQLQLAALQYTFAHHYRNNEYYRKFCEERSVSPDDIRTPEDLTRIPLISDTFFKSYPGGRDFATWLGNLYTGELPDIVIRQKHPTLDQVVDAFNDAELVVTYSSGTGGRHTFIPRDRRTFCNAEYALAKAILAMSSDHWIFESESYLLMPDPRVNSIYAGKASEVMLDLVGKALVAIEGRVSITLLAMAMGGKGGIKGRIVRHAAGRRSRGIVDRVIDWLVSREEAQDFTYLSGSPYLLHAVLQELRRRKMSFHFGERGGVVTGGGWKIHEDKRLPASEFRAEVYEVLGIPEAYCIDVYSMVEGNGWMVQCPEGHYLHAPYSFYKPMVLDEALKPVKYGEWGRFAFLDASALSYPGFIITGDRVRMLQRCPVCDRPGPVLDPEVTRAAGQEDRGCTGEVRRLFSVGEAG